ncbi:MAG: ScyD/ScyE family protein [Ignavibacteriaceae bacterium]|jgi:sugar lactone lactonase YvrE
MKYQTFMIFIGLFSTFVQPCVASSLPDTVTVYASGLENPIGIEIDGQGRLWVAESGTGNDDSQVSIVTTDGQVHPFLVGLPSEIVFGDPMGAMHVHFDVNGDLLIVQGGGFDSLSASILRVDTSGFSPGDPPFGVGNIQAVYDIGTFVLGQGFAESNPFRVAIGPNDDLYITDAAANAIIRLERSTGDLSVFVTFDPIGSGDAVPTGIVYAGNSFYVGVLTGFPYTQGTAKVYEVDLSGNVSIFRDGLTAVVDLNVDPRDSNLVVLQIGGIQPNAGGIYKLFSGGATDTLADGLNFPTGMHFNPSGDLFVSTFDDGQILKVNSTVSSVLTSPGLPEGFVLQQNYPNPFNPTTTIRYSLPSSRHVALKIYDILGREVITLVNELQAAGNYNIKFDAIKLSSGLYFYKITAGSFSKVRKMMLIR